MVKILKITLQLTNHSFSRRLGGSKYRSRISLKHNSISLVFKIRQPATEESGHGPQRITKIADD